jgi:2-methylcitrate dehydratase
VAIAVAKEVGDLGRIASIEIAATQRGYQQAGSEPEKWTPDTRDTADHSLPYITARAMFDGDITNASYAPAKLREPNILAFMRKITVKEDPVLTARTGPSAVPTRITATLDDGRRISREADDVPGFVNRPMGRADIDRKFRGNVGSVWSETRTDAALKALWGLETAGDISGLLKTLTVAINQ